MAKYASYILYLLIAIFVVILYVNDFGPLESAQQSLNDLLVSITAPETQSSNVVLVTIDGKAQDEYGRWPWNRDRLADLAAAVAGGEPRVLVLDVDLFEDAVQDSAGYTDVLAGQMTWMKNVVLPYDIALATYRSSLTSNPPYLFDNSIHVNNALGLMDEHASLMARKVFLPADKLLANHPILGFDYESPDSDGVLRRHSLLVHYEGFYYPSMALLAASRFLKIPPDMIEVEEGKAIRLGDNIQVPMNSASQMLLTFSKSDGFKQISAATVLSDGFDRSVFKGKLVIVHPDTFGRTEKFATPVTDETSAAVVKATAMANIINGTFIIEKNNQAVIDMLILFAIGALCAFLLPRVNLMSRIMILGGGLFVLINVNYFLVASFSMLSTTVYIMLELVLFMLASPMLDSEMIAGEKPKASSKSIRPPRHVETAATVGRGSGVKTRELKDNPNDPDNLPTTALSESGRQATAMFGDHQTISLDGDSRPSQSDSQPTRVDSFGDQSPTGLADSGGVSFDSDSSYDLSDSGQLSESQQFRLQQQAPDIKNLGRYQVTGILGKGAMGLVYKGIDPAINRPVALKTIRLDFVSDPAEMEELKQRLHREAQAAGKLSHPNIVTIYDVGSEGPLQYIAMEYLEGVTLEDLIKKKTKFNYRIIAQMILQICAALEYAHDLGIVHRDIKPANIMVLADYRVKVMDYGIARVDSNSMTKTGIAMGTPNYISPEQLKGLAIDRRADLFSLGVVMYEMLLGRRPFRGENITSLIYSIMNHEPEKPSDINPQMPLLFDHIVAKALKKSTAERYQKASEIANSLKDFVESFASR
jgi:serine/threonine-protein kinase